VVSEEEGGRLAFDRVTLRSPQDGRVLVRALSLEVPAGGRAVIAGPSELTTALERAVARMWPSGDGHLVRPHDVMFLPERPYLPNGPLRHMLDGDGEGPPADEDALWAAIRSAGVETAVQRIGGLDVEQNWDDKLSLQEQRLLEVARILLAAPGAVVLTRLYASLGDEAAAAALAALAARRIGCLVLETELPPDGAFDVRIEIAPDGSWARAGERAAVG